MWCVKLSDSQRDALSALIKAQGEPGPALTAALEALDLARWDDLPEAHLPWDASPSWPRAQGIGEADVVWDLAAGMAPKQRAGQAPRPRARSRRAAGRPSAVARRSPRPALRPSLPSAISSRTRAGHLGADRLADRGRHVEADEVEQRQRAHRVAGAELHAGVDRLGRRCRRARAAAPRRTGRGRAGG